MSLNPVAKIASRILQKNDRLSPFLFDDSGIMLEERRRKILDIAQFIFSNRLGAVGGLEISDIILIGSHATYMYHDYSDIDVNILVANKNNPCLNSCEKNLDTFLALRTALPQHLIWRFRIDGKNADFKLMAQNHPYFGIYSVLNNRWNIRPDPGFNQKFKIDHLVTAYYRRLAEIYTFMASLDFKNEKNITAALTEMEKFYAFQVIDKNVGHPFDYMVYKILEKRKQMRRLAFHIVDLTCRCYSFRSIHPENIPLSEGILKQILNPQPWLNPFVFDEDGNFKESRRSRIIDICRFLFNQKLGSIPGVELADIVLSGSSASFYYRRHSDLDIKIIVKNRGCSYISVDEEDFSNFLELVASKTPHQTFKFILDGKPLDIKFYYRIPKAQNVFSLLKKRWLYFYPSEKHPGIAESQLISGEFDYISGIYKFLQKLPRQNGRLTPKAIKKIFHLFYQNDMLLDDAPEYKLIYHLLRNHDQLTILSSEINSAVNYSLSF